MRLAYLRYPCRAPTRAETEAADRSKLARAALRSRRVHLRETEVDAVADLFTHRFPGEEHLDQVFVVGAQRLFGRLGKMENRRRTRR